MSVIENLLLNVNDNNEIKTSKNSKGNFLFDLLNTYKNDSSKLIDLLKNLNINENDLDKFFENKKELTPDLKNLINKIKISLKTKLKEPVINIHNHTKNEKEHNISEILKFLINSKPVSNDELEKKVTEIKKEIKKNASTDQTTAIQLLQTLKTDIKPDKTNFEEKIVKITKKIIISQKTLEQLKLTDKEINEFKNIKSFKELIKFANSKNLNISKIILSHEKETKNIPHFVKPNLPKNKIELKTGNKKSILPKTLKTEKNTQKELLCTLLQKKTEKTNSQNTKDNLNKHHQKESKNIDTLSSNITKKTDQNEIIKISDTFNDKTQIKENAKKLSDSDNTNVQHSSEQNIIQNLKQNIHKAKESIKHFANNLKEAVENYKPPVSKLSMELHPKELGKVEVTLVHRGDNLQIQINSNNTAVGFMHSQQQELKQNLINMGFTDVNMSFNQNQQQGNKEYRQNQKFSKNSNEENDELIIEIPYQYA